MSELSGEKIEELLWEAGCDIQHKDIDNGIGKVDVTVGLYTIVVGETFWLDGAWFVDTDTLTMDKIFEDQPVESDISEVESEQDLVDHILALGGEK